MQEPRHHRAMLLERLIPGTLLGAALGVAVGWIWVRVAILPALFSIPLVLGLVYGLSRVRVACRLQRGNDLLQAGQWKEAEAVFQGTIRLESLGGILVPVKSYLGVGACALTLQRAERKNLRNLEDVLGTLRLSRGKPVLIAEAHRLLAGHHLLRCLKALRGMSLSNYQELGWNLDAIRDFGKDQRSVSEDQAENPEPAPTEASDLPALIAVSLRIAELENAYDHVSEALRIYQSLGLANHPAGIHCLTILAQIALRTSRVDDALAITSDAVARLEADLDRWPGQRQMLPICLGILALAYQQKGRSEEACLFLARARAHRGEREPPLPSTYLERIEEVVVGFESGGISPVKLH